MLNKLLLHFNKSIGKEKIVQELTDFGFRDIQVLDAISIVIASIDESRLGDINKIKCIYRFEIDREAGGSSTPNN